jgi:penicillin amidase
MVLDVGNWDESKAINTPGQSGNSALPHYRDLAPLWARGEYFPLVYSPEAVARATRRVLHLEPAGSKP